MMMLGDVRNMVNVLVSESVCGGKREVLLKAHLDSRVNMYVEPELGSAAEGSCAAG